MPVLSIGDIPIKVEEEELLIKRVNFIPALKSTLISSYELTRKGWEIWLKRTKLLLVTLAYTLKLRLYGIITLTLYKPT
jgi:hypothetical protein